MQNTFWIGTPPAAAAAVLLAPDISVTALLGHQCSGRNSRDSRDPGEDNGSKPPASRVGSGMGAPALLELETAEELRSEALGVHARIGQPHIHGAADASREHYSAQQLDWE